MEQHRESCKDCKSVSPFNDTTTTLQAASASYTVQVLQWHQYLLNLERHPVSRLTIDDGDKVSGTATKSRISQKFCSSSTLAVLELIIEDSISLTSDTSDSLV